MAADDLRIFIEYLRKEGRVIKGAPLAFAVCVLFVAGIAFGFAEWHYNGEIGSKDSTIQNQQSRIAILEGELKGASPQLAALEARRAASRKHLLGMYIAAGPLMRIDGPIPDLPENRYGLHVVEDYEKQVTASVDKWEKETSEWIGDNLGPAAQARFLDVSNMPTYVWTFKYGGYNYTLSFQMNRLSNERKNLSLLIESSAYDK